MKRIQYYLYIAILLLCAQGVLAQTGVTRSGDVGSAGSGNFQFVNKSGQVVSFPRLSRSGDVLSYSPLVTTDSILAVTGTTATVYGNVVFNGWIENITERGFQICFMDEFVSDCPPVPVATNQTYVYCATPCASNAYSYTFTNLEPGTTYHVRAYATNSKGTQYGNVLLFTTTGAAPTVVTGEVSALTATTATVSGEVTDDGALTVTARGICWGTESNPKVDGDHTEDNGVDASFTGELTGLTPNTLYHARAYATNSAGTSYGEDVAFMTYVASDKPCTIPITHPAQTGAAYQANGFNNANHGLETVVNGKINSVTDYDGNVYIVAQIGSQCWLAENMRCTHSPKTGSYIVGDPVLSRSSKLASWYTGVVTMNGNEVTLDSAECVAHHFGLLYNWNATMDTANPTNYVEVATSSGGASWFYTPFGECQGICPIGWHVPTEEEWAILEKAVSNSWFYYDQDHNGYHAGKLAGGNDWNSSSTGSSPGYYSNSQRNNSGFTAVPAGRYEDSPSFSEAGQYAYFWVTTQNFYYSDGDRARGRYLQDDKSYVYGISRHTKHQLLSVRCLRDELGNTAPVISSNPCTAPSTHTVQTGALYQENGYDGANYGLETETAGGKINSVTDFDGNEYPVVQIGSQCWLAENMRCTHSPSTEKYIVNNQFTTGTDFDYTYSGKMARWYNNDSASYAVYHGGLLYNWNAAMDVYNDSYSLDELSVNTNSSNAVNLTALGKRQGICPKGWHVPNDAEWTVMESVVNGNEVSATAMESRGSHAGKLAGGYRWEADLTSNASGNYNNAQRNSSSFRALPAGFYNSSFNDNGNKALFWSSTQYESDASYAYYRGLYYNNAGCFRNKNDKYQGLSLRCLRDEFSNQVQIPTAATADATNLTQFAVTLNGSISNPDNVSIIAQGFEWKATEGGSYVKVAASGEPMMFNLSGLTETTSYTYRAFVTSAEGTAYGDEISFTTLVNYNSQPCPGISTPIDYDANTYGTVQIGLQCWMKENMKTTHYSNGDPISNSDWQYPNNSSANMSTYGLLYKWSVALNGAASSNAEHSTIQGVCPDGWFLPTRAEWEQLQSYVSSISAFNCSGTIGKALAATSGWNGSNNNCSPGKHSGANGTGFSAVAAGHKLGDNFNNFGEDAYFWTTTQQSNNVGYYFYIFNNGGGTNFSYHSSTPFSSVRCVRSHNPWTEGDQVTTPTVTTSTTVTNLSASSVTISGNVTSDGGAEVTERGVCWSTGHNPVITGNHTACNTAGTGEFDVDLTEFALNTTHYARAYAVNSVGVNYGNEISFIFIEHDVVSAKPCTAPVGHPAQTGSAYRTNGYNNANYGLETLVDGKVNSVTDYDGNEYPVVQIGNRCWLAENMRCTHSPSTGTYIVNKQFTSGSNIDYTYTGKIARWYNNDSVTYAPKHQGLLYNWNAAVDVYNTSYSELSINTESSNATDYSFSLFCQGICPIGWHVPSDAELTELTDYVNSQTAYKCGGYNLKIAKSLASATTEWETKSMNCVVGSNPANNNATGFDAVPTGRCSSSFGYEGQAIDLWSSSQNNMDNAWHRTLSYDNAEVIRASNSKDQGFAVRCLRDIDCAAEVPLTPCTINKLHSSASGYTDGSGGVEHLKAGTTNQIDSVTDQSGNTYPVVQIGTGADAQCWMAANLRATRYADGAPSAELIKRTNANSDANHAYYGAPGVGPADEGLVPIYGYLYNWQAATAFANPDGKSIVQGICPKGWHVPSKSEFSTLLNNAGLEPPTNSWEYDYKGANYMAKGCQWKETSSSTGRTPGNYSHDSRNISGFGALPAGFFGSGYNNLGERAYFWASSVSTNNGDYMNLQYDKTVATLSNLSKLHAVSVRCLRDKEVLSSNPCSVPDAHFAQTSITYIGNGYNNANHGYEKVIDNKINSVTDYEGNEYPVVQIGGQCWLAENLRTTRSADGTPISVVNKSTSSTTTPYIYNNTGSSLVLERRGYLYNWSAALAVCPIGWHLPSDAEWTNLTNYVSGQNEYICGGTANYIAKVLASTSGWTNNNNACVIGNNQSNTNNASKFSAFPAAGLVNGSFTNNGWNAYFWSSYEQSNNSDNASYRKLDYNQPGVSEGYSGKDNGFSVRCLRDETGSVTAVPAVSTSSTVTGVTFNSATVAGNVTSDGGADVTERGVCWSTEQNPDVTDSHAASGTGTGEFTVDLTNLTPNTTYYVRAYATNSVGTSYGEDVLFTTLVSNVTSSKPCSITPTHPAQTGAEYLNNGYNSANYGLETVTNDGKINSVTDFDGNVYPVLQLGSQCWLGENLRCTHSPSTGKYIVNNQFSSGTTIEYTYTGKMARWYNNDSATYAPKHQGLLYNWNAAVDIYNTSYNSDELSINTESSNGVNITFSVNRQGICPIGWHVPSDAELTALTTYVGSQNDYRCSNTSAYVAKSLASSTTDWNTSSNTCAVGNNPSTNNATGFDAVPTGSCRNSFDYLAVAIDLWSSTQSTTDKAWSWTLYNYKADVTRAANTKLQGFAVRCIRDVTGNTSTVSSVKPCTVSSAHPAQTGPSYHGNGYNSANYGLETVVDEKINSVTDYDGNVYPVVQIGNQCWLAENMRCTHSPSTGKYIVDNQFSSGTNIDYTYTGKMARWYNNDSVTCAQKHQGLLYNWNAAVDVYNTSYSSNERSINTESGNAVNITFSVNRQGVCPTGWHIPSDEEFTTMITYVNSQSGNRCNGTSNYIGKSLASSTADWNTASNTCSIGNNPLANNATGFDASPIGSFSSSFGYAGHAIDLWSSSQYNTDQAWRRTLYSNNADVTRDKSGKYAGFAVRCLRDENGNTATVTSSHPCTAPAAHQAQTSTSYQGNGYNGANYGLETLDADGKINSVTDYDGNEYPVVQIGSQCWLAENMRCTHSPSTGSRIVGGPYRNNGSKVAVWYTGNVTMNGNNVTLDSAACVAHRFGLLYNWCAAMDTANPTNYVEVAVSDDENNAWSYKPATDQQGICPRGWHVPDDLEWTTMESVLQGSQVSRASEGYRSTSYAAKITGGDDWNVSNVSNAPGNYSYDQRNSTGFSAVPAGIALGTSFNSAGEATIFWTSSESSRTGAPKIVWRRDVGYNAAGSYSFDNEKQFSFSVRCLRDETGLFNPCDAPSTHPAQTGSTYRNNGYNGANYGLETETDDGKITSVTDYDGNEYPVVQIGSQCWLAENMRCTHSPKSGHRIVGNPITNFGSKRAAWVTGDNVTMNDYTVTLDSAACVAHHFGLLYNWCAAMDTANPTNYVEVATSSKADNYWSYTFTGDHQGICPKGWHVPSDAEWNLMEKEVCGTSWATSYETTTAAFRGSHAGKLSSGKDWNYSNYTLNVPGYYTNIQRNSSGFSAVPVGISYNSFIETGQGTCFWSSTQSVNDPQTAWRRGWSYNREGVYRLENDKAIGFSVRCLRDETGSVTAVPAVSTSSSVTGVTFNSATVAGNVTSDGGADVTERGVCWSTEQNPDVTDSHAASGIGTGEFTVDLTGLTETTTYYARAYAINSEGVGYGDDVSFTTTAQNVVSANPCHISPSHPAQVGAAYQNNGLNGANHGLETVVNGKINSVTDYDGNEYPVIHIISHCWLAKNLRVAHSSDGTPISEGTEISTTTPYLYNYSTSTIPFEQRGYLYNWLAATTVCPVGWHLPTEEEWNALTGVVGNYSAYICNNNSNYIAKAMISKTGWSESSSGCNVGNDPNNNATGFDAVPSGYFGGSFNDAGAAADFWCSTPDVNDNTKANTRYFYQNASVNTETRTKSSGFSVRCARDIDPNAEVSLTPCTVVDVHGNMSGYTTGTGGSEHLKVGTTNRIDSVSDQSGNTYPVVQIGTGTKAQCWMAENLRATNYAEGVSTASLIKKTDGTDNSNSPYYSAPASSGSTPNESLVSTYGYLYNWNAATANTSQSGTNKVQGICPKGWHIPSKEELTTLLLNSNLEEITANSIYRGACYMVKGTQWTETSITTGRTPGNYYHESRNISGFGALPAGTFNNSFYDLSNDAYFWSSSVNSTPYCLKLEYNQVQANITNWNGKNGFSVRCLRDEEILSPNPCPASVTHPAQTNTNFQGNGYNGANHGLETTVDDKVNSVTDYDGNEYPVVQIGSQCWLAENLRTTRSADGTPISIVGTNTSSTTTPYIYNYTSSSIALERRGYLYNWSAALTVCPIGWHLPSDEEWTSLTEYVSGQSDYICGNDPTYIAKSLATTSGWRSASETCAIGNGQGTNTTGFSAVPAGLFNGSNFERSGDYAFIWSSSENNSTSAWRRCLDYGQKVVYRGTNDKVRGHSVRCLRDENGSTAAMPTVTTSSIVTEVTTNSATAGGNVTIDGGANVTERGVCWGTEHNPDVTGGHAASETGTGEFTVDLTNLTPNTTYYVRAYATNSVGTSYGEEVAFTLIASSHPCTIPAAHQAQTGTSYQGNGYNGANHGLETVVNGKINSVTDYDGNEYPVAQIGNQCWLAENMRCTHSPSTHTYIVDHSTPSGTNYTYTGKQARWYTGNVNNVTLDSATCVAHHFGLLYNWNAAVDVYNTSYGELSINNYESNAVNTSFSGNHQGICPLGWHVPGAAEMLVLESVVNGSDGSSYTGYRGSHSGQLAGGQDWNSSGVSGSPGDYNTSRNVWGFTAVPAGKFESSFEYGGTDNDFWSSSQNEANKRDAWGLGLANNNAGIYFNNTYHKYSGRSVRCLRD